MSRKKMLQGLVALGILAAVNAPAYAMEEEIVSYGGYDIFRVQYFDVADRAGIEAADNNYWNYEDPIDPKYNCDGLTYAYNAAMKKSLYGAFSQWAEILYRNGEKMNSPAWFIVGTSNDKQNASAEGFVKNCYVGADGKVAWQDASIDYFFGVFQKGFPCEVADLFRSSSKWDADVVAYGLIRIGENLGANLENNGAYHGWAYESLTQQGQSENTVSLQPVIFHEIAHAIGIGGGAQPVDEAEENTNYVFDGFNNYVSHLVD